MSIIANTPQAIRDIKTRQHLMERSFAQSTLYGFDRARWRGLWKVAIQEYLVSAIQDIKTLVRYLKCPTRGIIAIPLAKIREARLSTCLVYHFYVLSS